MLPERHRPHQADTIDGLNFVIEQMIEERLQEALNPFFRGLGEKLKGSGESGSNTEWLRFDLLEMAKSAVNGIFDRQLSRAKEAFLTQKAKEESKKGTLE